MADGIKSTVLLFSKPLTQVDRPSSAAGQIGFFDSGVGGLTVWHTVRLRWPSVSTVYFGDCRYAPYGQRESLFVIERSVTVTRWLEQQGVDLLVVACNTATLSAFDHLKAELSVPVIGITPDLEGAVRHTRNGIIGVLATHSTLENEGFQNLLNQQSPSCRFLCQPGHGLVDLIEGGQTQSDALLEQLEYCVQPIVAAGADTLVLGSTHFVLLKPLLGRTCARHLTLVENTAEVARAIGGLITDTPNTELARERFCANSAEQKIGSVLHQHWQWQLSSPVELIEL